MKQEHKLFQLFLAFLKIGALTFGGGLAMMPIMHKEVVENKGWVSDDDVIKMLVISESTPGVFAVNSATFIGYKIGKFWGALVATLAVTIPSFIIISLISLVFYQFKEIEIVMYAFYGIQVGVAVLIFKAAIKLGRKIKFNALSYIILIAAFAIALFTSISVIYILLVSAVIGMIIGVFFTHKEVNQDVA